MHGSINLVARRARTHGGRRVVSRLVQHAAVDPADDGRESREEGKVLPSEDKWFTTKYPKMGSRAPPAGWASDDVQQMQLWALASRELSELEPWLCRKKSVCFHQYVWWIQVNCHRFAGSAEREPDALLTLRRHPINHALRSSVSVNLWSNPLRILNHAQCHTSVDTHVETVVSWGLGIIYSVAGYGRTSTTYRYSCTKR